MGPLFSVISVPRVGQVHLFYLAELQSDRFSPGPETQEAKLFSADEIPWEDLAFRTVKETIELYLADRNQPIAKVHNFVIR